MAGRKKLPDGEKKITLKVYVKKKNIDKAKKHITKVIKQYNT